jgi:hypothetical protein
MADDARVEELLERLLESGGTPEEVCRTCLEAAELCFVKNDYATAAHPYAEALAAAPRLTEELRAGHRFNAARAALAGCGRGDDVAGLSEPERQGLRQQAREWLRLDLAAWAGNRTRARWRIASRPGKRCRSGGRTPTWPVCATRRPWRDCLRTPAMPRAVERPRSPARALPAPQVGSAPPRRRGA